MRLGATKTFAVVLLAVSAVLLTGCIKSKQVTTIMPDGSGKMVFRIGFNAKAIEQFTGGMGGGMGGGDTGGLEVTDPTDVKLEDLGENFEGFVAFTMPVEEVGSDGWKYTSFTGYFEDINKVRLFNDAAPETVEGEEAPERKAVGSFTFTQTDDGGYLLTSKNMLTPGGAGDLGDQAPPDGAEEMEGMSEMIMGMIKPMLKGMELVVAFNMPGEVKEMTGLTEKSGRDATFKFSGDDVMKPTDLDKMKEEQTFKVVCGPSQVTSEQIASFKAELLEAKMKWEEMKARAAAAAESEEGADEEEEGDD